jgi:hypothetical protein
VPEVVTTLDRAALFPLQEQVLIGQEQGGSKYGFLGDGSLTVNPLPGEAERVWANPFTQADPISGL